MNASGFDPAIVADCQAFNGLIDEFLASERVGHYLTHLTPQDVYLASGVRVLPLEAIRDEIHELAPGAVVFRFGYLPIASSIGGNAMRLDTSRPCLLGGRYPLRRRRGLLN